MEERISELVAGREEDGGGRELLDVGALEGVEVVEAVEEDRCGWRMEGGRWRRKLRVNGGEFAVLWRFGR